MWNLHNGNGRFHASMVVLSLTIICITTVSLVAILARYGVLNA